jgi:hypothetical protein
MEQIPVAARLVSPSRLSSLGLMELIDT